jgi:hypothetical protein
MNKFIVEIDKRRLEGRSSMQQQQQFFKKSISKMNESTPPKATLKMKGVKTPDSPMGKTNPMGANTKSLAGNWKNRGRKPFVCP